MLIQWTDGQNDYRHTFNIQFISNRDLYIFGVVLVLVIYIEDCKIYKENTNKNGKISKT